AYCSFIPVTPLPHCIQLIPRWLICAFSVSWSGPLRAPHSFPTRRSSDLRELIRLVSKDLGWDFYLDETLFQDLLQHVSAALNRAQAPMPESNNPLLYKIIEEYEDISYSVQENLKTIFPNISFLSNELVYIVIHFASAYERNPRTQSLSVLVICSSGVGTAKILESRLRKNVPEITEIKISQM